MPHATHTIAVPLNSNVITITAGTAESQVNTAAILSQVSTLTLSTLGATGNVLTATLEGVAITYTLLAEDTTLAQYATKLAAAINSNATYNASSVGAAITIARTTTVPATTTTFTTTFGSTGSTTGTYTNGQTATITPATGTNGVDGKTLQDTFIIDFKSTDAPASISFEFASGLTQAQAVAAILAASPTGTTGVTMVVANDFDTTANPLTSGDTRIKFTYNTGGVDTNTATDAASVTAGNTPDEGGTPFSVSAVTTVTEGADAIVTGTLDTWSVTVDGTEYTGTFSTTAKPLGGLNANEQAAEIVRVLNIDT